MSTPWSSDHEPGDCTWPGLRNGNLNPAEVVAGLGLTVTDATASGEGARPVAPGKRIATWQLWVNRRVRAAVPVLSVVTQVGVPQAALGVARNRTCTR